MLENYKITVIGDSICKGVVLENNKIKKLDINAVSEIAKYFNIDIKNNSIFGQSLKRVYQKNIIKNYLESIDQNENNVLIISMGGNDSDFDWEYISKNPFEKHTSFTTITDFYKYLNDITLVLKKNNINVIYTTLFPIDSKRYFENVITKKGSKDPIMQFLHNDLTNISRYQQCFSNAILRNAIKHKCKIIDISTPFLMDVSFLDYLSEDGLHPNAFGQSKIAETVINQIKEGNFNYV